ncbi:MAG: GNAT family N-acetyltransferase [Coriobacteriia bacterium]
MRHWGLWGVRVERLGVKDAEELLLAIIRSRALHAPWVEPPSDLEALRDYLAVDEERAARYGVRTRRGELAGVISLNSIVRGAFQNAFLGYYALSPHEGEGMMRAGLAKVLDLAFSVHGLHRVEANVQPANARSAALVKSLGFRLEGHSPKYLYIAGDWRDHDRYALTAEEWPGA